MENLPEILLLIGMLLSFAIAIRAINRKFKIEQSDKEKPDDEPKKQSLARTKWKWLKSFHRWPNNGSFGRKGRKEHPYTCVVEDGKAKPKYGRLPFSTPTWWKRIFVIFLAKDVKWTYFFIRGENDPERDIVDLNDRFLFWGGDILDGDMSTISRLKRTDIDSTFLEIMGIVRFEVRKDAEDTVVYLDGGSSLLNRLWNTHRLCKWPTDMGDITGEWHVGGAGLRSSMWARIQEAKRLVKVRTKAEEAALEQ